MSSRSPAGSVFRGWLAAESWSLPKPSTSRTSVFTWGSSTSIIPSRGCWTEGITGTSIRAFRSLAWPRATLRRNSNPSPPYPALFPATKSRRPLKESQHTLSTSSKDLRCRCSGSYLLGEFMSSIVSIVLQWFYSNPGLLWFERKRFRQTSWQQGKHRWKKVVLMAHHDGLLYRDTQVWQMNCLFCHYPLFEAVVKFGLA